MSLNIQSLPAKYTDLKCLIISLLKHNCSPDIICIQETWNVIDPSLFSLPNYQPLIVKCRQLSQGGGVGFYIREGLNFNILPNPIFVEKVFESLFVEVIQSNNKRFVLGNIYRSNSKHPNLSP